jgi:hypothetical protein
MFRRISCFNIRKLHLACPAVFMAAGLVLVPALSHARDIVPSIRPVVALKETATRLDQFLLLLESPGQSGSEERLAFKQHFFAQKNADGSVPPPPRPPAAAAAPANESPAVAAPAKDDSATEPSADTSNSAAKPDPNFDRWQKDANERLKEENAIKEPPPHPLATANPGKSVVVCEAGCRTPKDEIVYIAEVVAAVVPEKKFEPNSANPDDGSAPCIAGCYDRDEPKPSARHSRAKTATIVHAAAAVTDEKVYHRVVPASAPAKLAGSVILSRFGKYHRTQLAQNGAIVEGHRHVSTRSVIRQPSAKTRSRASALSRKKIPGSWRAHITRNGAAVRSKQSLLGSSVRTGRANVWQAYVYIGSR